MPLLRRSVLRTPSEDRVLPSAARAKVIMGLDPSLSSTGYAYRENGKLVTSIVVIDKLVGPWRLHYARKRLIELLDKVQPDIVVYEDYAMGKGGKGNAGRVFSIGELGGVLKEAIWFRGIDIHLVSPGTLKKFATGQGNPGFVSKKEKAAGVKELSAVRKKALVGEALRRDFAIKVFQNDEADAAGLLLLGEAHAGITKVPESPLKSARADAMKQFTVVRGKLQSISKL